MLTQTSSVLAVIPHYACEDWLGDCLESLMTQTRRPDGIAVIDDASAEPPVDVVRQFPAVTLLSAARNVGPYCLTQEVILRTGYDGYLLQDADDWSARERLALLLQTAHRTGAGMVGSQEVRIVCEAAEVQLISYPLDVNDALARSPTMYALLHSTSLLARGLTRRIGGFSTGLRFGGDTEFVQRAIYAARIVNVEDFCYFRRKRSGSLTEAAATGHGSTERQMLEKVLRDRALENAAAVAAGAAPCLAPYRVSEGLALRHIAGPALESAPTETPSHRNSPQGQIAANV